MDTRSRTPTHYVGFARSSFSVVHVSRHIPGSPRAMMMVMLIEERERGAHEKYII